MKPKDRFDLEQEIMNCWRVTDDIDSVAHFAGQINLDAKDQDALLSKSCEIESLKTCSSLYTSCGFIRPPFLVLLSHK